MNMLMDEWTQVFEVRTVVDRNRRFACQCKLKNAFTSFVVDLCMTVCHRMHYAYWLIYISMFLQMMSCLYFVGVAVMYAYFTF